MTIKANEAWEGVYFAADGLTGAVSASRYAGGTTSGAPTSGPFATGDFVVAQDGHIFVCTAGGTPGTWRDVGGSGSVALGSASPQALGAAAAGISGSASHEDHVHPTTGLVTSVAGRNGGVTLTAADIGAGTFPGAVSFTGLVTANAGATIPSGQPFTTGTRSVVTGSRSVTTNASDTVNLGVFSTTGGAIELRIHAHLAAPAAGTTASVTKVYEFAANATMGTVSTWYLLAPADASANAAATNDFALEVERTASGTFSFRFRQKSIGLAGAITFIVETLGDTAVTFTPSTTITAAPAAVSTFHPSNGLTLAAGNVGIGTDSPGNALSISGRMSLVGADTSSALITATAGTGSTDGRISAINAAAGATVALAAITTAGTLLTDTAANDSVVWGTSSLKLGVGAGASMLHITGSDVQINDNGTARSLGRGVLSEAHLTATTAQNITTTALTAINGTVSTDNGAGVAATNLAVTVSVVSGRLYMVLGALHIVSSVTSDRIEATVAASTGTLSTYTASELIPVGNRAIPAIVIGWYYAAATGSVTFTAQMDRAAGTGNVNAAQNSSIAVMDWGG